MNQSGILYYVFSIQPSSSTFVELPATDRLYRCVQLAQVALQMQYPLNDHSPIFHCSMHPLLGYFQGRASCLL